MAACNNSMGGPSRRRIFGDRVRGAKISAEHARERVREAAREVDAAECLLWSEQMEGFGGPAQPSPTIAQCLNGGYGWLEVMCKRCQTRASLPLDAIQRPAIRRSGNLRRRSGGAIPCFLDARETSNIACNIVLCALVSPDQGAIRRSGGRLPELRSLRRQVIVSHHLRRFEIALFRIKPSLGQERTSRVAVDPTSAEKGSEPAHCNWKIPCWTPR
jgi:hypothetical protein